MTAAHDAAHSRLTAFGNQLVTVHVWLRERLDDLRDDVDAYLAGDGPPPLDLRAHCLSFCSALTRHHTGEDGGPFPLILDEFPELRPVIVELRDDHRRIDWALGALRALLGDLPARPDPAARARIRAEVEGVAALMETHFGYEERKIVDVLNGMDVAGWRAGTPDFLRTDGPG